jgi:hypothetical protein
MGRIVGVSISVANAGAAENPGSPDEAPYLSENVGFCRACAIDAAIFGPLSRKVQRWTQSKS